MVAHEQRLSTTLRYDTSKERKSDVNTNPGDGAGEKSSERTQPMKGLGKLATLFLGGIVMTQALAAQTPNAATDPRIDPQVRSFLADLNKDSSPFWELPQPRPQEILTALQNKTPVDMSGVTTTERTVMQDGRNVKLYIMTPLQV